MICLTGDIHHMSMRTHDQRLLSGTEAEAALKYVEIAARKGLKVTLFATGRVAAEEARAFREISSFPGVELGGHGHRGRRPRWLYEFAFRRLFKRLNGPASYQAWEIGRTLRVFRERFGLALRSWRDHAYRHDRNTFRLLAAAGIKVISDELGPETADPRPVAGLLSLPINVWPDHDCLAHGVYEGAIPDSPPSGRETFPARYLSGEEWLRTVVGQTERISGRGGVATLLVHPACMGVLDGFEIFTSLCDMLSKHRSLTATEAAAPWRQ